MRVDGNGATQSGTLDKNVLSWSEAKEKIPNLMDDLIHLERSSLNPNVSRLFSKHRKTMQEARKALGKSESGSQRASVFHVQDSDQLDRERERERARESFIDYSESTGNDYHILNIYTTWHPKHTHP